MIRVPFDPRLYAIMTAHGIGMFNTDYYNSSSAGEEELAPEFVQELYASGVIRNELSDADKAAIMRAGWHHIQEHPP